MLIINNQSFFVCRHTFTQRVFSVRMYTNKSWAVWNLFSIMYSMFEWSKQKKKPMWKMNLFQKMFEWFKYTYMYTLVHIRHMHMEKRKKKLYTFAHFTQFHVYNLYERCVVCIHITEREISNACVWSAHLKHLVMLFRFFSPSFP